MSVFAVGLIRVLNRVFKNLETAPHLLAAVVQAQDMHGPKLGWKREIFLVNKVESQICSGKQSLEETHRKTSTYAIDIGTEGSRLS